MAWRQRSAPVPRLRPTSTRRRRRPRRVHDEVRRPTSTRARSSPGCVHRTSATCDEIVGREARSLGARQTPGTPAAAPGRSPGRAAPRVRPASADATSSELPARLHGLVAQPTAVARHATASHVPRDVTWRSPSRRPASALPSSTDGRPSPAPTPDTRPAPSSPPRPTAADRAHDVDAQRIGDVVALDVLAQRRRHDVVVDAALQLGELRHEVGRRQQAQRRRGPRVVALDQRQQPRRRLRFLARRQRVRRRRPHVGRRVAQRAQQRRDRLVVLDGAQRPDGAAPHSGEWCPA